VGAGISVTPNAVKALVSLGLGEALAASAQAVPVQHVHEGITGRLLKSIDRSDVVSRYGAPYLMMHRADLHALLVAAVRANDSQALRTGQRVVGITAGDTGARLTLDDGSTLDAAVVIGADGARSPVRTQVFGDEGADFTGHVAWRLLVPAADAPASASEPGSKVWTGAERSFVRYAVRSGTLINCVGLTRSGLWRAEGWSQAVPVSEMAQLFADFVPEVRDLIAAAPGGMVNSWGLFVRPVARRMVAGTVALLGDAAHPMLPFMGQGAAMAIEDGVMLGRCFAEAPTATLALGLYQQARLARCQLVQAESALGADRLQQAGADARRLARDEDSLGLFDYDPSRVEITALP
uniref:FAD-dependent monooxygenase n=1 Tax=Polymorphobacter sp. TaxID=1909290 RepID=UPI003F728F3A